jgi:GH15 family glucan-1,4-alpha-glucosidase
MELNVYDARSYWEILDGFYKVKRNRSQLFELLWGWLKGKTKNVGPSILEDWEKAKSFVKFSKLFYIVTL